MIAVETRANDETTPVATNDYRINGVVQSDVSGELDACEGCMGGPKSSGETRARYEPTEGAASTRNILLTMPMYSGEVG